VELLAWVRSLPAGWIYAGLGLGAALENVVPVVPADTFVVLGGFLAATGQLEARWVFLCTWFCNVASALLTWAAGRRYGAAVLEAGWGRHIVSGPQLARIQRFYDRWGLWALLFTRFLPGLRAVVPVFAGVTGQSGLRVALPIATASAAWYGGLVVAGDFTGRNLEQVLDLLGRINLGLLAAASVVIAAIVVWWWRTRHHA